MDPAGGGDPRNKNHHVKDHVILVDDFRCMNNTHFDEKTGKEVGFPGEEGLIKSLLEINPRYEISFLNGFVENDVLLPSLPDTAP